MNHCNNHRTCIFAWTAQCLNTLDKECAFIGKDGKKKPVVAIKVEGRYLPLASWSENTQILEDVFHRCKQEYECALFSWSSELHGYVMKNL